VLAKLRSHLTHNLVAYLALFVALGGGAYAAGMGSPGRDGTIKACYQKKGRDKGQLRVIERGKRCRRSERGLRWSQRGRRGQQGSQGIQGERGPQGPAGEPAPVPSCPAGATLVAAVCVETQIRPEDKTYANAETECLDASRRLPTVAELQTLYVRGFAIGRPGGFQFELTSSTMKDDAEFLVQVVFSDGSADAYTPQGSTRPFRCVAVP
jgi:hypothetical protein